MINYRCVFSVLTYSNDCSEREAGHFARLAFNDPPVWVKLWTYDVTHAFQVPHRGGSSVAQASPPLAAKRAGAGGAAAPSGGGGSTTTKQRFVEVTESQYSRAIRSFIGEQPPATPAERDMLKALRREECARQMFVAADTEGLVVTKEGGLAAGRPIAEYTGVFALASEQSRGGSGASSTTASSKYNFTLEYR